MLLGNATLAMDVLPVLTIFEPDANHTWRPIFLLFINLGLYHLCCASDPGVVSRKSGKITEMKQKISKLEIFSLVSL